MRVIRLALRWIRVTSSPSAVSSPLEREDGLAGCSKLRFVERTHKVTKGRCLLGAENSFLISVRSQVDHRHVESIMDDLGSSDAIHPAA